MDAPKYTCPDCGSLILNRAYPKCERCHTVLPAELLFAKGEADKIWNGLMAQHQAENDCDRQFRNSLAARAQTCLSVH